MGDWREREGGHARVAVGEGDSENAPRVACQVRGLRVGDVAHASHLQDERAEKAAFLAVEASVENRRADGAQVALKGTSIVPR